MKKIIEVTVIVPVYNAEGVLRKCLDSLSAQSYPYYEVIVVDDGSGDGTGELADSYAARDDRFVVIHKTNGGVSSARNEGLLRARGNWLVFVDADDWVENTFLQELMETGETDLTVGGYHTVGDGEIGERCYPRKMVAQGDGMKEVLERHLTDMTFLCPWGKRFRKSIVEEVRLRFCTDMRIGEDVVFVWSYLAHCRNMAMVDSQGYIYATEKNDFKYALDGEQALETIRRIMEPLTEIERRVGMDIDYPTFFVYNYYIWLYKLYVKRCYTWNDRKAFKRFFQTPEIRNFFHKYRHRSKDKILVHWLLQNRMYMTLYFLIKIKY